MLSGPSGSGKDTVLQKLLELDKDIALSISSVTRDKRENEVHGVDYYFISASEFKRMIEAGEFLEYAEYDGGNCYGTPRAPVEKYLNEGKTVILEIEIQGAEQIKKKLPDAVSIFLMPPSIGELRRRLDARQTNSEESIKNRIETAVNCEIPKAAEYDYLVINESVDRSAMSIKHIIEAERLKTHRNKHIIEEVLKDA